MSYRDHIKVIATFSLVYPGERALSIEECIAEMQFINREALCMMLSKLNTFLSSDSGQKTAVHLALAGNFLSDIDAQRLYELEGEHSDTGILVFVEFVLNSLFKLNLQHNNSDGADIDNDEARHRFAKILFSLNELEGGMKSEISLDETLETVRYSQARQYLLNENAEVMNLWTRVTSFVEIMKSEYPELASYFQEQTNLDLETFFQLMFTFLPKWSIAPDILKIDANLLRTKEQYFKNMSLDEEILDKFLELVSFPIEDFNELNDAYSEEADISDSYRNFIVFIRKPVLKMEVGYLCISPTYLELSIFETIYSQIRLRAKTLGTNDLVPRKWGLIYEKYASDSLIRTFGDCVTLQPPIAGSPSIDAIVELHDTVLLIEIKYPHWRFTARLDPSVANINEHLNKLCRYKPHQDLEGRWIRKKKGLGQVKSFYEKYKAGELGDRFDFKDKFIIPVQILGESFPFDPMNRKLLDSHLVENECIIEHEDKVLPPILLSSDDLERLESFTERTSIIRSSAELKSYAFKFRNRPGVLTKHPTSLINHLIGIRVEHRYSRFMRANLDRTTASIESFFVSQ